MTAIQATILIFLMLFVLHPEKQCSCKRSSLGKKPRVAGCTLPLSRRKPWNRFVVKFTMLMGTLWQDVFVEVFDNPSARLERGVGPGDLAKKQKRIAACKTVEDGRFCFANIPSGRYELRYTKDASYETKSVIVTIGKNNQGGSKKEISVSLEVSH